MSFFGMAQPMIHIGAPLPLTGKLALEAAKQQRGYELWAKLVNEQGGIDIAGVNHRVHITYQDYQPNAAQARSAVETLILTNKVHLLFAPYGSQAAREASAIAQKYRVPMIAVTASSQQTYSRGHQYIFGIFTPNKTLIDPLMTLIKDNVSEVNNAALLVRKDLFPLSIAREVLKASKAHGIKIVYYEKYAVGSKDYSTQLATLKALPLDWIVALGYTADLVLLRKQMANQGVNAPILTMIAAPAYQEFVDATGLLSENVTSSAWWHPAVQYSGNTIFGSTENFVNTFQEHYGTLPDYVEASAALAGSLFQMAIERANSLEGERVRNELAKFNETTFWGPIVFAENGQNKAPSPLVFQIQHQKTVVIYPPNIATGTLQLGIQ